MWRHWREVSANGRWRWGAVDGDGAVFSDEEQSKAMMAVVMTVMVIVLATAVIRSVI